MGEQPVYSSSCQRFRQLRMNIAGISDERASRVGIVCQCVTLSMISGFCLSSWAKPLIQDLMLFPSTGS